MSGGGGGGGGEKTEKATPKRLKEARHDGKIGNTPELGMWLGMLVASFLLPPLFSSLLDLATGTLVEANAVIRDPDTGRAMAIAGDSLRHAFVVVLPMAVVIGLVGIASVALQGRIWFSPKLLKPTFSRMNPLNGLKRMFGPQGLWQVTKALFKTAVLGVAVWLSLRSLIDRLFGSGAMNLQSLIDLAVSTSLNLLRYAAVAGLLMAAADFAIVRKRNNKQLKMSKHEIKEEHKSSEGDPHFKAKIKSRQLAIARNRMMRDVPGADVVLVNPTHVAVALKYEPDKGAPKVVAKGADHMAARIRAVAEEHRIPMVRDVPLARTLHASVEIGQEIPPDLYMAVATVLAFIMKLKRRGSTAGVHTVKSAA